MLIGVDVDEVLANFIEPYCDFHNRVYGTSVKPQNFHSYKFWEVHGGTRDETTRKVHEFYATREFASMEPHEGSHEAVELLSLKHEMTIITSRLPGIEAATVDWIKKYYPGIFLTVNFTHNSYAGEGGLRKAEIISRLGVDVMIEDSAEYALQCSPEVEKLVLIDRPWNRAPMPSNVVRVTSWDEIPKAIDGNGRGIGNYL